MSVSGVWELPRDVVGGVTFNPSGEVARIELHGHTLTVDGAGIVVRNPKWSVISGPGIITSNQSVIDIKLPVRTIEGKGAPHYGFTIGAVIADSTHRVGLRITGNRSPAYGSVVSLLGSESNTFTGDVEISGSSNYLVLGKRDGATAIHGNIRVGRGNGGVLRFDESGQVSRNTQITLNNGTIYMSEGKRKRLETAFKRLVVEGRGAISFGSSGSHVGQRYIYLDDLLIKDKGYIEVVEWAPDRDFFLVSKKMDKAQLDAYMGQIYFKGWAVGRTHLEDYDKDYWSISGLPEPAAYGAILGAVGLGAVMWRRRCVALMARQRRAA